MTDDELIEKMARAMCPDNMVIGPFLRAEVTAALAVARPIIEAPLRAENEKLRAALKPFAEALDGDYFEQEEDHADIWESPVASVITFGDLRAAAAAIREGE